VIVDESTSALDLSALLFDTLGYTEDEFVSIAHKNGNGVFSTAVGNPTNASAYVAKLSDKFDIYYGVNPIRGPARNRSGRGKAKDVTRLAALWADLDTKASGCGSLSVR
jgi:hypothetical protein